MAAKAICAFLLVSLATASLAGQPNGPSLPPAAEPFKGVIEPTRADSKSNWPSTPTAQKGAPNILIVMTDDAGYASASTFGGPIPTPNLDTLAGRGLKYSRFHTTGICSPTRASLLTGRNHHAVGSATVADLATGFPGYTSEIPKSAASFAEILRQSGYNTAMFGKHHNTPNWELSAAGPYDRWPTGMGFEYFFGFQGGDADQFHPRLFRGTTPLDGNPVKPGETLDVVLIDDMVRWLANQEAAAPAKPWLMYWAPGTMHAPHQAPKAWIERFRGQFDQGWDKVREDSLARQKKLGLAPANTQLSPRPAEIQPWTALSPDQKKVASRMMEVAAATLAHQDNQFGRLLAAIDRTGERDNTLIIFIEGDNGASGEGGPSGFLNELTRITSGQETPIAEMVAGLDQMGGPRTYQNYPAGWAWAMNAPFPYMKQLPSHLGGNSDGMVISWPSRIAGNGIRTQFSHVNDILPTLLEVAGIDAPASVNGVAQQRIDGTSLAYSFADAKAPERHITQYFEVMGARGVYHQGWFANSEPRRMPWQTAAKPGGPNLAAWELYDLNKDFSQSRNLAAANPVKLAELKAIFDAEARANQVYPIDDSYVARGAEWSQAHGEKRRFFHYGGDRISVHQFAAPALGGPDFRVTVKVTISRPGQTGVVAATGSWFGGWSFFVKDGKPMLAWATSERKQDQGVLESTQTLPAGPVVIDYVFASDTGMMMSGGTLRILINGREVASTHVERTLLRAGAIGETFDIGRDTGVPVTDAYAGEGAFDGAIESVEVKIGK